VAGEDGLAGVLGVGQGDELLVELAHLLGDDVALVVGEGGG